MIRSSDHTVRNETGDSSVGQLISKLQNAAHQQKASHNFKTLAQIPISTTTGRSEVLTVALLKIQVF
jgi:hypothetical protein